MCAYFVCIFHLQKFQCRLYLIFYSFRFLKINSNKNSRRDNLKSKILMNSPKQSTQRRMLSPKNTVHSPKFGKLAARSPNGKLQTKKPQAKTTLESHQSLRDSDSSRTSNKLIELRDKIPQRVIENLQHDVIEFQNKDRYEGGVKQGNMYGHGTYYFYQQNLKYIGEFYDNLFHGWGSIRKNYANQNPLYQGNFQNGKKHGEGRYEYGLDHYYNGQWQQDMKDGKGIYSHKGELYNGEWRKNKKHGEGTLKLNDKTQYKGLFQDDYFTKGLIKYPNGDQYSGDMSQGLRQRYGTYTCFDSQERYKGQWKRNIKNGKGTVFFPNGDELEAIFLNGKMDQTQSCTYKWRSGPDQGNIFNGWFKNGRPQKGHVVKSDGTEFDTY